MGSRWINRSWLAWLASIAHSPWLGRGLLEGAKETLLKYAAGLRMPRPAERGISTRRDAINISLSGRGIWHLMIVAKEIQRVMYILYTFRLRVSLSGRALALFF